MVCEQIVKKFKDFDPDEHFVIAPEGLARFYSKGFGGDVVATWMTKRDRLHEISDFSAYLSLLYEKYEKLISSDCKKIILGFSQGGTTAFRWLHHTSVKVDVVVGYSCWIPEDIDLKGSKTDFTSKKLIYTYGLQDPYLTSDRILALEEIIAKNNLDFIRDSYEGDHRVDVEQLNSILNNYIR